MSKFNEDTLSMEQSEFPTDLGKQLRRAREASNLSIQSVANSLHLTPRIIIALEENDFTQFQPVFAKGYLRNYGRLLNLSVEPLLESYNQSHLPSQDPLQVPVQAAKAEKSLWIIYFLLVVAIVAVLAWVVGKIILPFTEPVSRSEGVASPVAMSSSAKANGKTA